MNTYKAFYKGKAIEVHAETQLAAQKMAAEKFKARKSYEVAVVLMAVGDREVIQKPQDICP